MGQQSLEVNKHEQFQAQRFILMLKKYLEIA